MHIWFTGSSHSAAIVESRGHMQIQQQHAHVVYVLTSSLELVYYVSANLRCHQLRVLTKSQDWCVQSDTIRQHPELGTTEESNIVIAGVSWLMAIT